VSLQGTYWLRSIRIAVSLAELKRSVGLATEELGFQYFDCQGRFPNIRSEVHEFQLANCPTGWQSDTSAANLIYEPLYRRALREVMPIFWRELIPYESNWIARARKFGLATGVTLPVHGSDARWSALSLIKNRSGAGVERDIRAALGRCQLLSIFVHDAADRIIRNQAGSAIPIERSKPEGWSLTGRERDCLIWTAAGKTIAEVASTLSVTERTVVFHLTNARRKLGVTNSHHAIMKAVSLGHIKAA
jgi:LuxR family transcriptional activator of bioluminescence operon